jgi:beta-1,4-N-acetylglucosaminyltransferase
VINILYHAGKEPNVRRRSSSRPFVVPKQRRSSVFGCVETPGFSILITPRAREVGQSFVSSIFSTLYVIFWCIPFLLTHRPEVILTNGPGTCVPVCLVAYFFRLVKLLKTRIVFVESVCRVKTLSLSGKILRYFVDDFFVQWPELLERYPKATYLGRFV